MKSPRLDALSFVTRNLPRGSGFNYWNVEATGSYSTDCEKGRLLAAEFLDFLRLYPTNGNAALLPMIIDSMMVVRSEPRTKWGSHATGLEIGFLGAINKAAMVGVFLVPSVAKTVA